MKPLCLACCLLDGSFACGAISTPPTVLTKVADMSQRYGSAIRLPDLGQSSGRLYIRGTYERDQLVVFAHRRRRCRAKSRRLQARAWRDRSAPDDSRLYASVNGESQAPRSIPNAEDSGTAGPIT